MFPSPLSPFDQVLLRPFPWLDKSRGILHLVAPLVHPIPSFPRWRGHTVMLCNLPGILKIAARHNISSTSFTGPVNEYDER